MTSAKQPPSDPLGSESVSGEQTQALSTVIATAMVTAAVVPFVQELAKRVADDSYDAVRSLLKSMFRDARAKKGATADPPKQLLIVRDDDPGTQAVLYAKPDMSDTAIEALSELDLDAIASKSRNPDKIQIFWNETSNRWQINRQ